MQYVNHFPKKKKRELHTFFYNQHYNKQRQTEIGILHPRYQPRITENVLKSKKKNKCVCILDIIQLIIMKMKMKMTKRSHRFDINRSRSRHGRKHSKYKMCLSNTMLVCIKQHLSNI